MIPFAYQDFISKLTYLVENNAIPVSRIDDAVKRILRVKFTVGLFENPFSDPSLADQLGNKVAMPSLIFDFTICCIRKFCFFLFFGRNTVNWLGKL